MKQKLNKRKSMAQYFIILLFLLFFIGCTSNNDIISISSPQNVIGSFNQDEEQGTDLTIMLSNVDTYYNVQPLNISSDLIGDNLFYSYNESLGSFNLSKGFYQVFLGMSFSTSKIGIIHCDIFKGISESHLKFERSINNVNQVGNANTFGYIELDDWTLLSVKCKSSSINNVLQINDLNFNINKIN